MTNLSIYKRMSYSEALLSKEALNCGIYIVLFENNPIYIGKASSVTLKRRLGEHVSFDNQYNTLVKKVSLFQNKPLRHIEQIIEIITKDYKFILIPYLVHCYNENSEYKFDKDMSNKIKVKEKILISEFNPLYNKRSKRKKVF
jgi:GIY-YIG catalytic domain